MRALEEHELRWIAGGSYDSLSSSTGITGGYSPEPGETWEEFFWDNPDLANGGDTSHP